MDREMNDIRRVLLAIAGIGAGAIVLALAGCNSATTTTEYAGDGKTVTKTVTTTKESPATHKTFSIAGSVTALDVETSASTDGSSSAMPHVLIGGSAVSVSSSASEDNKPTFGYSWSAGIVKSLTSSSATSGSITYTGVKGETAAETQARVNAIMKLAPTSDSSTDSSSTNSK